MTSRLSRLLPFAAASVALLLGATGCALHAATDFGPQSSSARRSFGVGPEGLPGVSVIDRSGGDAAGARTGGYTPEIGGSPFSSDGGAVGSAGGR